GEDFDIATYLTLPKRQCAYALNGTPTRGYFYELRSGHHETVYSNCAYYHLFKTVENGLSEYGWTSVYNTDAQTRPAFVLKLFN
ncbi:MAG: hypothetical protein ACLRFR_00040, partial [Clostridia bacterium]